MNAPDPILLNEDIETGANSYIVKPLNFERLMEVATQIQLYWSVLNQKLE